MQFNESLKPLLQKTLAVLDGVVNKHGGLTETELAEKVGVSKKVMKEILLEGARRYVINAWIDQDPALTFKQADRKPLRYFKS